MPPDAPLLQQEQHRLEQLSRLNHWQFDGRISIRIERDGKTDGGSGSLSWQQQPASIELNFHAALGRGAWHLSANQNSATVRLADGSEYKDQDVDTLVQRQLGWNIPIHSLSCWLRGLSQVGDCNSSETRVIFRDESGRPQQLVEGDWNVLYKAWQNVGGIDLPYKLEFSAPGRKFKLVIKHWTLK